MIWCVGRILTGLICGVLLGGIFAIFLVPRQQIDQTSGISPGEQEQAEDRLRLWIIGVSAVASATAAGFAGRINLGKRSEFIAKGALAGAFLAVATTIAVSIITGDDPNYKDERSGRVHAFGRTFLLPFLTATGGGLGWLWQRMRHQQPNDEARDLDNPGDQHLFEK